MISITIICVDARFPLKIGFADFAGFGAIRLGWLKPESLKKNWLPCLKMKNLSWLKTKDELGLRYWCLGLEDLVAESKKTCLWGLKKEDDLSLCHLVFEEVGLFR